MERCSDKGLEEMKGAEAVAAEEEMRKEEAVAEEEMRATDFVVAYKRLPKREIEFILAHGMMPFESTIAYSNMIADSSTTKEDMDREAAEHKQAQESFTRFQDEVRREYEATGYFKVDDDYIAKRVEKEKIIHEGWSTMFDDSDLQELVFGYQSDYDDLEDDMNDVNSSATDIRNVEEGLQEEGLLCKL